MSDPRQIDIAIIGLSCRLPGAAAPQEYWKNLCDGVESITFFSDADLAAASVDPSLAANPSYVKAAAMLRDVEMFDAPFFDYAPRDAALMDPQHRLFLEVCWEAFESAGYDPVGYPGKVGVLATAGGVVTSYLLANLNHPELPGQTASTSHINNDKDFLSTRISYKFNLTGPSFTIQSACSSSLLAIHQACQNLRFGECDMMLVGGSVVRIPQVEGYFAEKRNVHSLDGHCRPFDAVGQGTIFGSGVGAVLLKPLDRAVADRDHIIAVVKGTAANNDGSGKNSYAAPSLGQQSQAIADALKSAGVPADSIGYVECHATGTLVGDPLEIEALTLAFRKQTENKQFCAIGSVKANIGHPEQAAGIAGLIKTALVLHHKKIPPSINYDTPNPAIDFASSPFYVNTGLQEFPRGDTPRRAGVNSLGIGGTNAFVVLEEAPSFATSGDHPSENYPCIATLSAKSAPALIARVKQLLNWLEGNPDASIGDVCYTTNVSRSRFPFRFATPARSTAELKTRLDAWLQKAAQDTSRIQRTSNQPIAFMFSGQGSQYAGMAKKLYQMYSVFRAAMDRCHALAAPHLKLGLRDVIFAEDDDATILNRTEYTQPALFAVEYSIAALLKSWGITPSAVLGHSVGEFAAAWTANVLSLEDATRLVTARGALMQKLPDDGGMTAIFAKESEVRALLSQVAQEIDVAAINGPENVVVSGNRAALNELSNELDRRGISFRALQVSIAFHSRHTEPVLDDIEDVAAQIRHSAPDLPLISNLTGELMPTAPDKLYWRRHLREPVQFGDGMLAAAELGCRTFLEIGPHPVLLPMAQACLGAKARSATWGAALSRQKSDTDSIGDMLATLYLAGNNIDWVNVHADAARQRVPLPTYPFQRQRHWLEVNAANTWRESKAVEPQHPLVGTRIPSTSKEVSYETSYGTKYISYVSDHRIAGSIVLPTTVELEAATVVARMHFGSPRVSFENAMHHQAMSFANGEDRTVRVVLTPQNGDRANFKLISTATDGPADWHTHMTGTLRKSESGPRPSFSVKQMRANCRQLILADDFYAQLEELGLEYGPSFRGVQEMYLGRHEALTKVQLPDGMGSSKYVVHPALLDACLQAYPFVIDGQDKVKGTGRRAHLPISVESFRCYQDGVDKAWVHVSLRSVEKNETQVIDIRLYDDDDRPLADIDGLTVRLLPLDKVQAVQASTKDIFYQPVWRASPKSADSRQIHRKPASWIIFADAKGIGSALAERLEASGARCHLVYREGPADQLVTHRRTWTVDERRPQDFRKLLDELATREPLPCDGVVYLWGLDSPPINDLTLATLKSAGEMMCRGALALLQALAASRSTNQSHRRVWFVTSGTQKLDSQNIDPIQAPLWGLGRSAAIEYPALWGGLIDLHLTGEASLSIDTLAAELLCPDGENQIAISADGRRYVPRFVRRDLTNLGTQQAPIRRDATYLLTGGLGMLGLSVAKWLIGKGAKHLVLTSRNANPEAARDLTDLAEANGAEVGVVAADIGSDEDVKRLMQTIRNKYPPLKGVVHSAGILDDGILALLNWDRFSRVFEPKVYGSWLLHEHTKSLDLDFFILQSSVLGLLGSAGQANYSAGNTFQDSLADYRRSVGLPATAINWSAWSGGGLATSSGARGEAMWSSLGIRFLGPDLAMQAFDELMIRDVEKVAVAIADWPTYAGKVGKPPFLAELLTKSEFPVTLEPAPKVVVSTVKTNAGGRKELLGRLQRRISLELGFAELIDVDQPLNEVGLDSLRSVALANGLEDEFGILIAISELISGPTINQLTDHLLDLFPQIVKIEPALPSEAITIQPGESPLDSALGPRANGHEHDHLAPGHAEKTNGHQDYSGIRTAAARYLSATEEHADVAELRSRPSVAPRATGKWLIAPRPNPDARARLFCFPFAGGGLGSFRDWAQQFNNEVEVVAVEAPGRGTRIHEPACDDLDVFVAGLLPEMTDQLDRPSAFFGHCLGGLTMFATLRALPKDSMRFVRHVFACGVRPPHRLKLKGEFEDNLVYDMMMHREFDAKVPPYEQTDDIFADLIKQFDTPEAEKMLEIPRLRKTLLPTIRAEFGMAYKYDYEPTNPFSFPISSFVGERDPWVSEKDSAGWGELTRGAFTNHVCKGSHHLMADDGEYILEIIKSEFANLAAVKSQ